MSVGTDHDTAEFAANSVLAWWRHMGRGACPQASRLHAVEPLGFTLSAAPMEFHGGKISIYRHCKTDASTDEELALDLLVVAPGIADAWASRRVVEWEGRPLKVVSPEGLILLKSFRRSGKDLDDIEHLRSITDDA